MSWETFMEQVRKKCLFKWLTRSGETPKNLEAVSAAEAYELGFRRGYWGGVEDGVAVGTDVGLITLPPQGNELVN